MESLEVIAKVTEPTDWVNSITTPEKQRTGALRVCLDPRDLNQAVKREHYPLPILEELTLMLSDAKYFSVLDATSGYWQIKLNEESSLLITLNTPSGHYRFIRMPFGIHSAQEVFQKTMDMAFEGGVGACVGRSKTCSPSSGVPFFINLFSTRLRRKMGTRRAAKINAEVQEEQKCIETEMKRLFDLLSKKLDTMNAHQERRHGEVCARIEALERSTSKLTSDIGSLKESCSKLEDELAGVKSKIFER